MKRVIWVVNPVSRPRKAARAIPIVEKILRDAGWAVETMVTQRAGDPARIVGEQTGIADAFLVAGGDGTINEVQAALTDRSTPLGIIPIGTSNVLAREVGISFDPAEAARAFVDGSARSLDCGLLGERAFLLMASYGFDAFSVRRVSLRLKKVTGRWAYFLSGLASLPVYDPTPIEIEPGGVNGGDGPRPAPVEATFAVFSNVKRYAGDYIAAPDAAMDDGLLDVVCWTRKGRLGAVSGVAKLFRGTLAQSPHTVTFRSERVSFRTARPEYFQVDGDPADGTEGTVAVDRAAFRLVTP